MTAAKRTTKTDPPTWTRADLRVYCRERAWGMCEWPECGEAGDEMAHVFGIGAGGRRSADRPENVTWLCRRHHDVLDGRRRFDRIDAAKLLRTMPDGLRSATCAWYCAETPTGIVAMRSLCARHTNVALGGDGVHRRTDLAVALMYVVARANASMGLRT